MSQAELQDLLQQCQTIILQQFKAWHEKEDAYWEKQKKIREEEKAEAKAMREKQDKAREERKTDVQKQNENLQSSSQTHLQKMQEKDKAHWEEIRKKEEAFSEKMRERDEAFSKKMKEKNEAFYQKMREENKTNIQLTPLTPVEKLNDLHENNEPEYHKDRNKEENNTEPERKEDKGEPHTQNNSLPSNIQNIQATLHTEETNLHIVQTDIQNCTQEIGNKLDTTHMGTEKKSETILTPETSEEKLNAAPENTEQEYNEDRNNKETYTENMKTQQVKKSNKGEIKIKIRKIKRKRLRRKHGNKGKLNKNKEHIHKQVIEYLYTNANEYKRHTLILGEKIGKRMAKKKPNLLYEGPFRIKNI